MMRKLLSLLALLVLMGTTLPQTVLADDDEGASSLEEGPPVRRLILLRAGRFEIQPQASFSLNDPFVRNIGFGAGVAYYFTNSLGIGANFALAPVHMDTDEIKAVQSDGYSDRVKRQLSVAELQMAFDAGLLWVPLFGKFSLFGWILNYDVHFFGGAGALVFDARCADEDYRNPVTNAKCLINDGLGGPKFAGVLGAGARIYFNNFMALNLEVRDYLTSYAEYARGENDDRSRFQNFFFGTVGFSFFFPFDVYISR